MNLPAIILFIKAPIPGKVKKRLAASIGSVHAMGLYKCFVKDITRTAMQTGFHLKIFYHPPENFDLICKMFENDHVYHPQSGQDLGEKMANAFCEVFAEKHNRAVLIGSDIPDLPEKLITKAMTELGNHDAVIGPSHDGGYYLIGFRSDTFTADIFKDISWSTDAVCSETTRKLYEKKLSVHLLPIWRDVDTYADLMDLADSLRNSISSADTTHSYLINMLADESSV
ncbi:MAG: TIGR04282 family arsenosugar biosynthesis glycosyltransferase [Desulfobacterales bacterium]|nr:TIGR04282 family arsenosugar biosynthesis glycosyltransferase [Desulfobacterales bacterium]